MRVVGLKDRITYNWHVHDIGDKQHLSVCLLAVKARAGAAVGGVGGLVVAADVDHVLVEARQSLGGSVDPVLVLDKALGGVCLREELERVEEVGLVVVVSQSVGRPCHQLDGAEQGRNGSCD